MKNTQISLYCPFNRIIKELGTSFQSLALSQKTCLKCFSYNTLVVEQILFWKHLGFKSDKHKCTHQGLLYGHNEY